MFKRKPPVRARRRVWRISEAAPMGQWVEVVGHVTTKPDKDLPEVSYGTWVTSSYDLLDGADVIDDPDTLPGELFDELFPPKSNPSQKP